MTIPEKEELIQLTDTMEFIGTFLDRLLAYKEYIDLGRGYGRFQPIEVAIKKERKSCGNIIAKLQYLHDNLLKNEFEDDYSRELRRISDWTMKELLGKTVGGRPSYHLQQKLRQLGLFLPGDLSNSWVSMQRVLVKKNSEVCAKHLRKVTSFLADVMGSGALAERVTYPVINALLPQIDEIVFCNAKENGCKHVKPRSGREEYIGIFDNPTDCAKALVTIQREIHSRNELFSYDERIYIRTGMNEGMVPFFYGEPHYEEGYGEGIVNAARMCSIADGGQIVVTESTAKNFDLHLLKSLGVQVVRYGQPVKIKEYKGKVCQLIWRSDQKCKPPQGCSAADAEWVS